MTYFFGTDFQGCVLYHLNGPNPIQPRLVTSIDGLFREASLAPLEDGSVLMGIRTTSQIQIGRLLADSFDYEELAIFPLPSSEEFRAFSIFVELDQSIHLAATIHKELTTEFIRSSLVYRRFDLDNFATQVPWESVNTALTHTPLQYRNGTRSP